MSDPKDWPQRMNLAMMARQLGMSRTRLYQLIGTTFPAPHREERGLPYFDRTQQKQIEEIYRTNVGLDGKTVFFRPKVVKAKAPALPKKQTAKPKRDHKQLLASIRALGLTSVKKSDLEKCLVTLFPAGQLPDDATLAKRVFIYLHGQNSKDSQQ
jgi:hypothetical protein